jgi:hypothetical protein
MNHQTAAAVQLAMATKKKKKRTTRNPKKTKTEV